MGLQRNKVITKITEKARASYLGSAWYGFFQINLLYLDGQMGSPRGGAEEVGGSGSSLRRVWISGRKVLSASLCNRKERAPLFPGPSQ